MDKQNQIIKEIFNNTARQIISSPAELYQFLMQNRYLYELPITTIIEIYGQNPTATKVKTFDEWSDLGGAVINGQKGIQTLVEPNNPYSKRTTYFDITQVAHKELNVESLMLTENQVFKFLELEQFDVLFPNDTAKRDFWRYIKDKAETGLANFTGLSEAEKAVVPLIAEFSLNTELNITTEADDLRNAGVIQTKFKDNPELRPLEIIKIANNLSKSILISIQKNMATLEKVAELENDKQTQFQTEKALVLEWVNQYKGFKTDEQRQKMLYRFEQSHLEVKHDRQDGIFLDSGGTVLFSDDGLIPAVLSEPSLLPDGFEPSLAPDNLRVYVDFALNDPESTLGARKANSDKFLITQVKLQQLAKYGEYNPVVNDVLENLTSVDDIWGIQDKIETAIDVANQVFNQDILAADVPEDIFTSTAVVEAENTDKILDEYQLPESSAHDVSDNLTVSIQYQAAHRFLKNQIERRIVFMENGALESDTPIAEIVSLIDKDNHAEMISNPFDLHFSKKFDLKLDFGMNSFSTVIYPGNLGLPDDFDLHEIVATINRQKNLALTIDKTKDEQLPAIEIEMVEPDSSLGEISLFDDIVDLTAVEPEENPQISLDEQVISSGKFYIQLDGTDNGSYYMDEIRMGDVLISTSSTNVLTNAMVFESYEAALAYIEVRDDDAQFKEASIVDSAGKVVQGMEKEDAYHPAEAISETPEPYKSLNNMLAISEYQKEMVDLNESEQLFVKNTVKNYLDDEAYNAFGKNSFSELAHDEQGGIVNAYAEQIDDIAKEKGIVLDAPVEPKVQEQPKEIKATTLAAAMGINVVNMDSDGQEIIHEPKNDGQFQSNRPTEPPKAFSFPENLTDFYPKTPTEKVTANLEAIRLVKTLEIENRQATSQEQAILAQYVSWGGLANTFFDDNLKRYEGQREALKTLVSTKEYAAMRRSSLTAYYTDPAIIKEIYKQLERQGFKGGRVLDPAMGTGNFFSAMPDHLLLNSELYGVELDGITGAIAKQLHPEADIKIQGFETTEFNDNAFDVVIGNVPFADFNISDDRYDKPYVIHDYFFKKSLDLVRDGGIVAFITSTGTMDKRNSTFRKEMSAEAGFIGGVRLPNNAFKAIAGTDVSTDILFFQKGNLGVSELTGNWQETTSVPDAEQDGEYLEGVSANRYFADMDHVAGHYDVKNFHGKTLTVNPTPAVELPHLIDTILSEQILPSPTFNSDEIKLKDFSETYNPTHMHRQAVRENDTKNKAIDKLNAQKENIVWLFEESATDLAAVAEKPAVSRQALLDVSIPEAVRDLAPQTHMIHDGKIYFNDGIDGIVEKNEAWFRAGYIQKRNKDDELVFEKNGKPAMWWSRGKWSQTVLPRLTAMVEISGVVQEIIQYQHDNPDKGQDDTAFQELLDKLNTSYDTFTTDKKLKGKYGNFLNRKENAQLFEEDLNYYSVLAIESEHRDDQGQIAYQKSDFFYKKTIASRKEIVASNPVDSLNASINRYGTINFEYMSELLPLSKEAYIAELDTAIYLNPVTEKYEQADEYLSGNIHVKLMALEDLKANDKIDEAVYLKNKAALDKVLPEPLSITEIDFKIGSRFIPTEVYQQFLSEKILGLGWTSPSGITNGDSRRMQVEYNQALSKYVISEPSLFNKSYLSQGLYNDLIVEGETRRHNPVHIFNDMLNLRKTTINYYDSSGRKQTNAELTAVAETKQKLLALEFNEFVMENEVIRKEIADVYNRDHNSIVVRTYDGSHFTFDGLTADIELRPHQKNAVSRVVQSQRGLFAHVVGSGKTLSMIASGMKLRELGLAHKPLYVVPKSILKQFARDMKQAYPDRNIISPSPRDFVKERRRKLIARIGAGDYDAVLLSHEQFGKIPLAKEREEEYLSQELESIKAAISKSKEEHGGKSPSVKQMVALEERLEKKLETLQTVKDDGILFENMGVDFLFVDEAHNFKNLSYRTELSDVKGVNMTASQKASDMLLKAKYLQENNEKGGGVVFATGTPVSNSMAEMYTMMRYLEPDVLESNRISSFDEWAALFAQIESNMEVDQTGQKWKQVTRFSKFNNLPELMKLYQTVADIQTAEMLDLPTPAVANDGKPFVIVSEPSEQQQLYMDELINRSDAVASGQVDPREDNMLRITTHARLMATDMRLIDPAYDASDSAKPQQVAENVFRIWEENQATKSTQMVFSDIGTPKTARKAKGERIEFADDIDYNFNVYQEIKDKLIAMGIPAKEIAFIHDAEKDEQKEALFEKVRTGEVRVLFASTQKGGTGVNVQDKLLAVHHVDVPWRPSDIEQRNGRIVRQGNTNPEVQIYNYVTKGTFDTFMWQIQEQKLKYITQVMSGKSASRSMDEMDDLVLTASEIKAVATNNPYIKEKMELENSLANLTIARNYFIKGQEKNAKEIQYLETEIPLSERHLTKITADKVTAEQNMANDEAAYRRYEYQMIAYNSKKAAGEENLVKPIEPPFELMLEGQGLITSKREAGDKINQIVHNAFTADSHDFKIGEYKGFEIMGRTKTEHTTLHAEDTIFIVGKAVHPLSINVSSGYGTMVRINNLLTDKIIKAPDIAQSRLIASRTKLESLKANQNAKFDKEDEFKQVSLRLNEVNQQIESGVSSKIPSQDKSFEAEDDLEL